MPIETDPGAKPGEKPKEGDGAKPDPAAELVKRVEAAEARAAAAEAKAEAATKEAIERRHENKPLKELQRVLTETLGLSEPAKLQEQITQVQSSSTARVERVIRRAAAVSALARAGAHDAEKAADLIDLRDLEVDTEKDTVKNPAALTEKVTAFRKASPWAFSGEGGAPTNPPAPPEPGAAPPKPPLTNGGSPLEQWRKANAAGDRATAQRLWKEHPEIRTQIRVTQ